MPVNRQHSYDALPEHVKLFLENLDPEDLTSITEGIKLAKAAKTMGKFWKWTFILTVSVFTGTAAFGQAAEWLWLKLKG